MSTSDTAQLLYLGILGGVIAFWFFVQNRQSLGKLTQQALIWLFIFIGAIAAVGLWEDIRNTVTTGQAVFAEAGRIELPRAPDGHYYLTAQVNGTPVTFVIDTGATNIVLSRDDAAAIGFDPGALQFIGRATTANGEVRTAPVRLDEVAVGPISDRGLRAFVNEGALDRSLLGMDYLQRFSSVEISGGTLILSR